MTVAYRVEWTPSHERDPRKPDRRTRHRIGTVLPTFARREDPYRRVQYLRSSPIRGLYALHVDDLRVVPTIEDAVMVIFVLESTGGALAVAGPGPTFSVSGRSEPVAHPAGRR